jgi:hypothetical protein
VPVGLFIYSMKTKIGLDLFRDGGFHAYMRCLSASFPLNVPWLGERPEPASQTLEELELLARNARAAALEALEYDRQALKLKWQGQGNLQNSKSHEGASNLPNATGQLIGLHVVSFPDTAHSRWLALVRREASLIMLLGQRSTLVLLGCVQIPCKP